MRDARCSGASGSVTSMAAGSTQPGYLSANLRRGADERAATPILTPREAKASASARPIPEDAPIIIILFMTNLLNSKRTSGHYYRFRGDKELSAKSVISGLFLQKFSHVRFF